MAAECGLRESSHGDFFGIQVKCTLAMVGVWWACTCSSIFVLVQPAHFNTTRTFVSSFFAFKSRNYTMCTCYGSFCVKAKGVTYERVHTDIGLYHDVCSYYSEI